MCPSYTVHETAFVQPMKDCFQKNCMKKVISGTEMTICVYHMHMRITDFNSE